MVKLVAALGLVLLAVLLALFGFGILVWGVHLLLSLLMPPFAAAMLTGVVILLLSGGLLWTVRRLIR